MHLFSGDDGLIMESLQQNEHCLFPALVTGEDMFQFNLQMLEQLMHEEEIRVQHRNTLFKLRVKVLGEMARTEVAALDLDKKKLRDKGEGHKDQMTALRKKQRGVMLRFQQQREELERYMQITSGVFLCLYCSLCFNIFTVCLFLLGFDEQKN